MSQSLSPPPYYYQRALDALANRTPSQPSYPDISNQAPPNIFLPASGVHSAPTHMTSRATVTGRFLYSVPSLHESQLSELSKGPPPTLQYPPPSTHPSSIGLPSAVSSEYLPSSVHTSSVHMSSVHAPSVHISSIHAPSIPASSVHASDIHVPSIRAPSTHLASASSVSLQEATIHYSHAHRTSVDSYPSTISHQFRIEEGFGPRFPPYTEKFEHATTYAGRFAEIHPGFFPSAEFKRHWNSQPTVLMRGDSVNRLEPNFRGVRYRVSPYFDLLTRPIARGHFFVIDGNNDPDIKYLATQLRAIGPENCLIQLNAYIETQQFYLANDETWPALLLLIPTSLCRLELPEWLKVYYPEMYPTLTRQQKISRAVRRFFARMFCSA